MTKSCSSRIKEIDKIDVYRAIVSAIAGGVTAASLGVPYAGYMASEFPDPVTYGAMLDTSAAKFGSSGVLSLDDAATLLGPGSSHDSGSMASIYESLVDKDVRTALSAVDGHWEGSAADTFTTDYMGALSKHLKNLADVCEDQRDVARDIEERITKAQDDLVDLATNMVNAVVNIAGIGGAVEVTAALAAVGGVVTITTGGLAAVGASAVVASLIIDKLTEYHGQMRSVISGLNTDLGSKLTNALDRIVRQDFDRHIDTYASPTGWRPRGGGDGRDH